MAKARRTRKVTVGEPRAEAYRHPEATSPMRPDVGTQPQFKKKKPPQKYRYDSSLSPALQWDGQNPAREQGEALIAEINGLSAKLRRAKSDADREATATAIQAAAEKLGSIGKPFLDWSGKAERLSFDVPTLPLFVHERLSTKAIIETLTGHRRDRDLPKQTTMFELFGDPRHSVADQVLRAYEHRDRWTNRMILGDSMVVMNSLVHYESLGGQVQMIYMDPPYGVKFGSNFQPFVRRRDVKHNDDEDLTREPEMVQAYRDTWELGLHSYLTYLRDRLLVARELLAPSGSLFVQISDENLHHVREVMDEVFGAENLVCLIAVQKAPYATSTTLPVVHDYLCWYAKDKSQVKYRQLFRDKADLESIDLYRLALSPDGKTYRPLTEEEMQTGVLSRGWRRYRLVSLVSQGASSSPTPFVYNGKEYLPPSNSHWKVTVEGLRGVAEANRIQETTNSIQCRSFIDDFPISVLHNMWTDTITGSFNEEKLYVVQTNPKVIERCLLMTTDPGDLVLDPTCGSGTTAYVAEQWGRRWITIDVSRVPLALARQRLLTATFPWYELADEPRGPAGGFVYRRKQNSKGEETGGIVPHVTLKSIANNEPPAEEVLVDRPETTSGITRVTGPFCFEATIPTPVDFEGDGEEDGGIAVEERQNFSDRMLEILRHSPILRLDGNKTVKLTNIRLPAKTLSLSAEAIVVNGKDPHPNPLPEGEGTKARTAREGEGTEGRPVAFVFGPENGAISENLVFHSAKEAAAKNYSHLYVIGFAIQPNARTLIDQASEVVGIPATYVQATPDLLMGDLLKNMRSSQIFSVCGLPEVRVKKAKKDGESRFQVELLGLDVFDPITMQTEHRKGNDVPAWLLDTDYNELCFHVSQAFFPRTGAWENLQKALKGEYDESVWDHLSGTTSAPFEAGEHGQIAVKVLDDRGNELLVVKKLAEAKA